MCQTMILFVTSQKEYGNLETLKLNSSSQSSCKEFQIPSVINTFHRDSPLASAHARSSLTEVFLPPVKKKKKRQTALAISFSSSSETL